MNISRPFILRPVATSLLMLGLLLAGIVAYPMLPVAPLPQVDFPTIQVSASLPGANPETMASAVATPLERQFAQIPGVSQMTSTSGLGNSSITIQFELDRNIDAAAQDVQAAINAAGGQLPKNLPNPPTYRKVNPADSPILILAAHSDTIPLIEVDDFADTILAQHISQIPGIAQVLVTGEQKPSVRVQIDPAKAAAVGLGLEEIRAVLATATVNAPKGTFDGPRQSFTIYDNDQLLQAPQYDDVVLAYRNGAPIRVRDIGRAVAGPENAKLAAWQNGARGVSLIVFKQPGANVIETADRVKAELPKLRQSIPPAIAIDTIADRTQTIRAAVSDVQLTLALTAGLVVMVIFLFLRQFWATAIPSVTVPLALLGTAGLMYLAGFSLDNLSLMGLTIAVGFVVDDAIVMIENIMRHIEEGERPLDAALKGAGEIGFTILSISLSLVAVFIPLLLMGGIVGRLLREFAVTVTMAICFSAFVSLTLTPMLSALVLSSAKTKRHGRLYRASEAAFDWLLGRYEAGLRWALAHRPIMLGLLLLTIAATVALYAGIPKGFFPQQDTGFLYGFSEAAQDTSFAAMATKQRQLAAIVQADPDVAGYVSAIGPSGGSPSTNTGRMYITLKPRDQRKASATQIIDRLRPKLAEVEGAALFLQPTQDINVGGRLSRTQYQYTLQDADLGELDSWAPRMLETLKRLPELQDVASDQQTGAPTVTMTIDRDTAARFGIQPQLIDDTLNDAYGQRQVAQYFTQLSQYHVILEVDPRDQADPASLDKIYLKSPITGEQVPLSVFVHLDTEKTANLSISHQGQFPAVTLSFNLSPGTTLGQAVTAIQKAEASIGKPATLSGTFQGTAQAFQSSLSTMPLLIAAALVVVYLILGMLYESTIHPLTILSTLPSAGLGALLVLQFFGFGLDVIGLIGIILLIGIVKKNGIMMIDFALEAERNQGLSPEDAIFRACVLRFRPIMMTTMAALFSGLPLMLGSGMGSEFRRPLGYAIVGGLLVSQAMTLFTTPVIYLYLDGLSRWIARRRRAAPRLSPVAAGPAPAERRAAE
ncbi:MAG: multidrug efflux RND transporter permease subunit [Dongiaceae bacterium]